MKKEKLKDMRRIISDDEEGKAADSLKNESLRYLLKWAVSQVAGADRPFNVRGSNVSMRQDADSSEHGVCASQPRHLAAWSHFLMIHSGTGDEYGVDS